MATNSFGNTETPEESVAAVLQESSPMASNAQAPSTKNNGMPSTRLFCRMYAARFPEVDDLVMVNVRQITDVGAYVSLLEYNNIEGTFFPFLHTPQA
jgi:hypothetical protein